MRKILNGLIAIFGMFALFGMLREPDMSLVWAALSAMFISLVLRWIINQLEQ